MKNKYSTLTGSSCDCGYCRTKNNYLRSVAVLFLSTAVMGLAWWLTR